MELYTLSPVYGTPTMMTPAYSEYYDIPSILSLYSPYTPTAVSSLPLSTNTTVSPMWNEYTDRSSVYSPSTVMHSMRSLYSPYMETLYASIPVSHISVSGVYASLCSVTLPLYDVPLFPTQDVRIEERIVLRSTGNLDANDVLCEGFAEEDLFSSETAVHVLLNTDNDVLNAVMGCSHRDEVSLLHDAVESFTEAFLLHDETVLSTDVSLVESIPENVLAFEDVLSGTVFFSDKSLFESVVASDLTIAGSVFFSVIESVEEFTACVFDADEQSAESFSTCNEHAEWNDFLPASLHSEGNNDVDDNCLVESSTADWSM